MGDDEFEWDDAKAEANLRKHRISFDTARRVFEDADALRGDDLDSSDEEDRFYVIGVRNGSIWRVIYTYRGERMCIISARQANKREIYDDYRSKSTS